MLERLDRIATERKTQHLWRTRRNYRKVSSTHVNFQDKTLLSFANNDYLGLSFEPRVLATYQKALERYGAGSNASQLVAGYSDAHFALEEALADFLGTERALLFPSGYNANLGVVSALLQPGDTAYIDRLAHASLLDGASLSRARFQRYPHANTGWLANRLMENSTQAGAAQTLLISDGVFSMEGDVAPLPQLLSLADQYKTLLLLDDTHGIGTLGHEGRGTLELTNTQVTPHLLITCSLAKAFGLNGGFVAGNSTTIEHFTQFSRSGIYTCALPPAIAKAAQTSLNIIRSEPERRAHLNTLIELLTKEAKIHHLPLIPSKTSIQSLLIGGAKQTMQLSQQLMEKGILVGGIRPPSVPQGTARLRITLTAAHTPQHVEQLLSALTELCDWSTL